jgi:hypothetical protein
LKRLVLPIIASVVLLSCSEATGPAPDQTLPLQPDRQITCRVVMNDNTMSCDNPVPSAARGVNFDVSLGGTQGFYVRLASAASSYNGSSTFTTNVTVQNETVQPMATADGTTVDPDGVRVFFISGPTVTGGTGTVTVGNATGTGTFTAPGQPYFEYDGILKPDSTSTSKTWIFNVPGTVSTFSFVVMVHTKLPDDQGVLHWTAMNPMTTAALGEVSEANGEVWAVGTGGTILHYDGSSWQSQTDPVPGVTLRGVEMFAGTPVTGLAVGDNATILRYDGTSWQTVTTTPSGGTTLTTLCRITANEAYIVGAGAFIGHSTNVNTATPSFTQELPPAAASTDYFTCGGPNASDVYVSGLHGTILHSTGNGVWTQQTSNTTDALRAMDWISNGNGGLSDIWLTGGTPPAGGTTVHSTGNGTWTVAGSTAEPVRGLESNDQSPGSDIFGVGTGGFILHWNGTSWSQQVSGSTEQLNHIAFRPLSNGGREWWIVGNNGVILHGTR